MKSKLADRPTIVRNGLRLAIVCVLIHTMALQSSGQFVFLPCNNLPMPFNGSALTDPDWSYLSILNMTGVYPIAVARDGTAADSLACNTIVNAGDINQSIALIYRGGCEFSLKALMAQNAGAVAVVIANNLPGPAPALGAGSYGSQINIPVISISMEHAAILRQLMNGGSCGALIGDLSQTGTQNIRLSSGDCSTARGFAIPRHITGAPDFSIPIMARPHSYYADVAINNIRVRATISRNGQLLYDQISPSGPSLSPNGDVLISLPTWTPGLLPLGLYSIEYTLTADNDEFPYDNVITKEFWVNDSIYSYGLIDTSDGHIVANGGLRPDGSDEFRWCQMLDASNLAAVQATGISFALNSTGSLIGNEVTLSLSAWWDDILNPGTPQTTFDYLNPIASATYQYGDDLQNQTVSVQFQTPINLIDNEQYLYCIDVQSPDVFVVTDGTSDYSTCYDAYPNAAFFPVSFGGTWYSGGFGGDNVPGLTLHLQNAAIVSSDIKESGPILRVFPNPGDGIFSVETPSHESALQVYDSSGQLVYSQSFNQEGRKSIDLRNLNGGLYFFKLIQGFQVNSAKVVLIK